MIMAQKLATIDKNTGVLVVLESSWVPGEIFSLLLVVLGAIASLIIANKKPVLWILAKRKNLRKK